MTLKDTCEMMCSEDYKERFRAEYYQLKERYERLRAFNIKIEAAKWASCSDERLDIETPKHDCPDQLLREQEEAMSEYLKVLEIRAVLEGIVL
jgi:hypothetical protein